MKMQLKASDNTVTVSREINKHMMKIITPPTNKYKSSSFGAWLYVNLSNTNPNPVGSKIVKNSTQTFSKNSTISTAINTPKLL